MRMSHPEPTSRTHPPMWRRWLLLGSTAVVITLLALPRASRPGVVLSYSRSLRDVAAGAVRAGIIDPAGQVTGRLAGGRQFAPTIPVALDERALAGRLAAHHVQITGIASPSSSPLSALIGFLPLLLFSVLLVVLARTARRQVASLGSLGGTGSLTRAKTRVNHAGRPANRVPDRGGDPP